MKTVVITGSTRGIGFAMAKCFLAAGCQVTLSGRGESLGINTQSELTAFTGKYAYIQCDVQIKSDLQKLWDISKETWGQIDIWINNAGQNAPNAFVHETDDKYVNQIIATNITGMVYGSQIAAKEMLLQNHGAIYSMEGLGSNNMIQKKTVLYGMTKHALTYFMKGLAKELDGSNVIAGRLSPGMMLTDFIMKTPDGKTAAIELDKSFQRLFNILADKPETVAEFFVPRILANRKNNVQISWLTTRKAASRFLMAPVVKRKLI